MTPYNQDEAVAFGAALAEVKARLPFGRFGRWLDAVGLGRRRAALLMRPARRSAIGQREGSIPLGGHTETGDLCAKGSVRCGQCESGVPCGA